MAWVFQVPPVITGPAQEDVTIRFHELTRLGGRGDRDAGAI
jgi:hypothetical protein